MFRRCALGPCLAVGLLLPASALAQPTGGILGGVTFTTISGAESFFSGITSADHANPGLFLGAVGVFALTPLTGVQLDSAYVQKHAEQSATASGTTVTLVEDLDYWETVLSARFGPAIGTRRNSGYVLVGFGFSVLLRARAKVTAASGSSSFSTEQDIKDDTTSGDAHFVIGGCAMAGRVGIEARYDFGLVNIDKTAAANDPTLKTRTFSVLGSVHFQRRP